MNPAHEPAARDFSLLKDLDLIVLAHDPACPHAAQELVHRYSPVIRAAINHYAHRVQLSGPDLEDAHQEAVLVFLDLIQSYEPRDGWRWHDQNLSVFFLH